MVTWCSEVYQNPSFSKVVDGAVGVYDKASSLRIAAVLSGGYLTKKGIQYYLSDKTNKEIKLNPNFNMYDYIEGELKYPISKKEILPINQVNPIKGNVLMKSSLEYIDRFLRGEKDRQENESVPVVKQNINGEIKYFILDNHDKYYAKIMMEYYNVATPNMITADVIHLREGLSVKDFVDQCLQKPETRILFDEKSFA
jgi:hypothetical protein